jgi:tripartite-type tricarboxylate transporter receptor subunit TctC
MARRPGSYKGTRSLILLSVFLFLVMTLAAASVDAAEKKYPTRPVNVIVPMGAGGALDLGGKIITERMSKIVGEPFVSVYKPGGGGSLGAAFVAKSKPDGYTILSGSSSNLVLAPIVKKIDYRFEDLLPIGIYGKTPLWLAVKNDSRWKTLKDFVEDAKKFPDKFNVGSYGKLTAVDFMIQLLNRYAGTRLNHVPYKSTAEALTAVIGGHADAAMVSGAGGLLDSGMIRILAAGEEKRLEGLPEVPTFKEFGYPIVLWASYSLCVPKATPREIIEVLSNAQKTALEKNQNEIKKSLREVEIWASFLTPQESVRELKQQEDLFAKLAKELQIVPQ